MNTYNRRKPMERLMFWVMLVTILIPYFTPVAAFAETLQEATVQLKKVSAIRNEAGIEGTITLQVDNPQQERKITLDTNLILDEAFLANPETTPGVTVATKGKQIQVTLPADLKGQLALKAKASSADATVFTTSYQKQSRSAQLPKVESPTAATVSSEEKQPAAKESADAKDEEAGASQDKAEAAAVQPAADSSQLPKLRAVGRDITTLPGANKMKNTPDGPSILTKAEIMKDGKLLKNGDSVDVGDQLSLNYEWQLPEELRQNMQGGDTFTFRLPDQFKVQNAPVTGDFIQDNVKYGTFVINADGTIVYTFTDNIKKKENLKGSMSATVYIDKEHIPDKGGNEIKVPYTYGTYDVKPNIVVPKDQSIDKEVVDDNSTKSQDIVNNKAVVQWKVLVNKLGFPMTNGKVTETLPKGVKYKDGLKVIARQLTPDKNGETGKTKDVTSQVTLTPDASDPRKFVLNGLPEVKANDPWKYEIVFNSDVDFNEATVSKQWGQQPTANLTNTVTLNSDQDKNVQAKATKTYTTDISYSKKIDKTASQPGFDETGYKSITPAPENENSNGVIAWQVPFKKVGMDAPAGTTIVDTMKGGQQFTDANGKILKDDEVEAYLTKQLQAGGKNKGKTVEVKIRNSTADPGTTYYDITFPDGFSDPFTFTYYTNVKAKSGTTLNNAINWNDNGSNDNYTVPPFSKGVKGYDKKPDGKPNIDKNNEVSWTINVNSNKASITNWFVEDTINQGGAYAPGSFTVTEYFTILSGREYSKELKQGEDYTLTQKGNQFKIETMKKGEETNSRFVVTYKTKVDPNSDQPVSNSFIYHYTHDHTDWETGGTQEFTPSPEEQRTLNASKSGEYFYDSETGEDKIRWKIRVNTDKIPLGKNAHFYDVVPDGQVWDDASEVKVYDESGNDLNVPKSATAFNNAKGIGWWVVKKGKNFYFGPSLNVNTWRNDTAVVSVFPEGDTQTYTIELVTKLAEKKTDVVREKVTNIGSFQDDKNKQVKPTAEVEFTRNNQSIDKVHQEKVTKNGRDYVPYQITVNRQKEKLSNVIVEDSDWENVEPDPGSVVVKDSAGKVLSSSKYTVEKTQQQLFISFNETITDSYTISYLSEVHYKKGTENTTITLKNSAKVTGDGFKKTPGPTPDGYDTKVPSVITSVTGDTPTTKLLINKIDPGEDGKQRIPLKGVLFTLYQAEADENGVVYQNGKAKIKNTVLKNIATDANGRAVFDKLEKGYYFLVETKTINNYLINKEYREHKNSNNQTDPGYLIEIADTRKTPELTIDVENMSIPIRGQKTWADDDNSRGKRPASITVNLLRDGKKIANQKVSGPDWKYVFDNQPAQDENGKDINYSIEEEPVPGYESLYNGTNIVNSILVDIPAVKVWDDNNNRDGGRTKTVTFTLQKEIKETGESVKMVDVLDASGKPMTVEVNGTTDNWRHTFKNLPKYDRFGNQIVYHILEKRIAGYNTSVTTDAKTGAMEVKNFNPPATTNVNGKKTWEDNNNQDQKRPQSIFIQLMKQIPGKALQPATDVDGKAWPIKEVKAGDSWAWSFNKVPKYEDGHTVGYSVREVEKDSSGKWVPVSDGDYHSESQGMDITNTQYAELRGHKQWFDENNADGMRPNKLLVILQRLAADGQTWTDVPGQQVVAQEPSWSYSFSNQKKYENGQEIQYRVREEAVRGATGDLSMYQQDDPDKASMDLKNTYTRQTIDISGKKIWNDEDNVVGARPKEITLRLKKKVADGAWEQAVDQDGKALVKVIPVGTGDITYEFLGLPKYENGQELQYRIEEDEIKDYSGEVTPDNALITNSNPPIETTVEGEKRWEDNNDQDGLRPKSIKVQLYARKDGKEVKAVDVHNKTIPVQEVKADQNGKWSYSFSGLPKFYKGHPVEYFVKELETDPNYQVTVDGANLVNTHTPEKTKVTGKKTWDDGNDQDRKRPSVIQVVLQEKITGADGQTAWQDVPGQVKEVKPDEKGQWSYSFTDLPKNRDGKAIEYRVREKVEGLPAGYMSSYTDEKQIDLTNHYTPETIKFRGTKRWDDKDNPKAMRPRKLDVFFTLQQKVNGTWQAVPGVAPVNPTGVQDDDTWQFEFPNEVPKYADGKLIEYRVLESKHDGYSYLITDTKDSQNAEKSSLTDRDLTVVNMNPPVVVEVGGTKTWEDQQDQDGVRPKTLTFELWKRVQGVTEKVATDAKGGPVTPVTVTPDPAGKDRPWEFKFTNLPKYEDGVAIEYFVKENGAPADYKMSQTDQTPKGELRADVKLAVTNTRQPDITNVKGQKTWQDDDDRDGMRPKEITVTLEKQKLSEDGTPIPDSWEPVLDAQGAPLTTTAKAPDWSYQFEGLVKNAGGQPIVYRGVETPVAGYTATNDPKDPLAITNTHTPELTKLTGKKHWQDDNDNDEHRPKAIVVKVMKLQEGKLVQAKDSHGKALIQTIQPTGEAWKANEWSYEFKDLYKYEAGELIEYVINEEPIQDEKGKDLYSYQMQVANSGGNEITSSITNTSPPETTEVTGTKTWADQENQDGKRPQTIKVQLMRQVLGGEVEKACSLDGKIIAEQVVKPDKEGRWQYHFTGLPKYGNGGEIRYSVEEVGLDKKLHYTARVDGMSLTNSRSPETTIVEGKKTWKDQNDQDGKRPLKIKVILQEAVAAADGKITWQDVPNQTAEAAAPEYAYHFERVAKYRDGKPIDYRVREEAIKGVDGDFAAYRRTDDQQGMDMTNSYEPETTQIKGQKVWDDKGNEDGKRPAAIRLELKVLTKAGKLIAAKDKNGKEVAAVEAKGPDWKYEFNELPRFADGAEIQYRVVEPDLEKIYTSKTSQDNQTVTNTYPPETTKVSGEKHWEDKEDQDGLRPKAIKVQLLRTYEGEPIAEAALTIDGKEVPAVTVTEKTKWRYEFTDLPTHKNGQPIVYSVKELDVPEGYRSTVTTVDPKTVDLVNTHKPEVTEFNVTKHWEDQEDQDGLRPQAIEVSLQQKVAEDKASEWQDVPGMTATLNETNHWHYVFKELPKNHQGQALSYRVQEKQVPSGYQVSYKQTATGTEITNSHQPKVTKIPVKKVWIDNNDAKNQRPSKIKVALLQNGKQIATKELTAKENWQADFDDLPVNETADKAYTYTVKELDIPNHYTVKVKGTTITNTIKPNTPKRYYPKTGEIVGYSALIAGMSLVTISGGLLLYRKRQR